MRSDKDIIKEQVLHKLDANTLILEVLLDIRDLLNK